MEESPISHSSTKRLSFYISRRIWDIQEGVVYSVALNGSNRMFMSASNVVQAVMEGATCGPSWVLPREQTRGGTRGRRSHKYKDSFLLRNRT